MDVILTENVKNLGTIGEVVKVKPGYGRNFLVPQGLAVEASEAKLKELEHHKRQLNRKAEKLSQEAADVKARIEAVECTFVHKASEEGKLFGSLGTIDIAEACTAAGADVQRSEVRLPDGPLKTVGAHDVEIHLHSELNVTITVNVVGDGADDELMESLVADEVDEPAADESAEESDREAE